MLILYTCYNYNIDYISMISLYILIIYKYNYILYTEIL